jgi:hypothetical protein
MTSVLKGCRYVPGWERTFLQALENGYSERTAASAAGIGTGNIKDRCDKDPVFKERYEFALANKRPRPIGGGLF